MRINKISVNGFGKFNDITYDLNDSLNLFYGHNEAGKSTLMSFIRTMLFGFPNRANMPERYEPLHGGRHGGRLVLTDEAGRQYRIERYAKSIDGKAHLQVTLDDGTVGGEDLLQTLLGDVSAEVFYHVYAFSLSELQEIRTLQSTDLHRFLSYAGTGVGARTMLEAHKQLTQQMDERFRPRGQVQPLNQLAEQLQEAEREMAASRSMSEQYEDLLLQIQRCEDEVVGLQAEIDAASEEIDWLERCMRGHEDGTLLQRLRSQLHHMSVDKISVPEPNHLERWGRWVLAALNIAVPGALVWLEQYIAGLISFVVLGVINGLSIRHLNKRKAASRQARQDEERRRSELEQEIIQVEQYLNALAGDEGRAAMEQQWRETNYDGLRQKLRQLQEHAANLAFRKNESYNKRGRLEAELARLTSEQQLAEQQQQYEELLTAFQQVAGEWASRALCLAMLEETKVAIDQKRQPKMMQKASEYLAKMTDRQFIRVMASLEEDVIKVERATGEVVDASLLSRGTAEQLYLALRLAMIEQSRAVRLPIVMDDIFVNFDPPRLHNTLSLIAELSEQRQIILFTCHPHIREQLSLIAPDHHCIAL